ncbi:hypothetical protein G9G53_22540 [Paenibacillus sp. EKM206P]|uniref:hypothetical protein n=1 Tax=Paenibacillus sp. EKM206P TaxID=1683674 RepID=UPI0013EA7576|nr:hypothetical protein [Paenibacillus sp. EKM206P]KAF6569071.1 hypothetical protein G9G53_22540 [Paenibacillus sp. EKM206P]
MSERTYKLPSGNELTVAKNKTVWYGLPGTKSILSDFYSILDLLALVDSLQQQVAQLQEMSKLHTSGAKQLVQDLHTLRMDRDELRKALEEIASEEMMIGSTPVKMRHIARQALGE